MKSNISINKHFLNGFFLLLFLVLSRTVNSQENITAQTSVMIEALKEIQRHDAELPGYPALVNQIFSTKKNLKKAEPVLTSFFETKGNFAGKRWLLNRMLQTGSNDAVKYIAELLREPHVSQLALMELQKSSGISAGKQIKMMYPDVALEIKVGILYSLGRWRDKNSIDFIAKQTASENTDVVNAAFSALGEIGTEKTADLLVDAISSGASENKAELMEALMINAEQLIAENHSDKAFELFGEVLKMNPPDAFAVAAIKGRMQTTAGNPDEVLKENLKAASKELKSELINLVTILPASFSSGKELLQLPGLTENQKLQLILQLARHGDKNIREEMLHFAQHENTGFHESALRALAEIAGTAEIQFLIKLAAAGRGEEQTLARRILYTMSGSEVDEYIVNQLSTADEELAAEYLKAIGERNSAEATAVLLRTAKTGSPALRIESYKTLAKIASPEESGDLIQLLLEAETSRERRELERTLYLVATKNGPQTAPTESIVKALKNTSEKENKMALMSVLGNIGNPDDVKVLTEYLDVEDSELQLAAIRALSEWPNAAPLEEFKRVMEKTNDKRLKALAVKGFTQLVLNESGFSEEKKVTELKYALEQAANDREKQLVISALGKIPAIQSLQALGEEIKFPGNLRAELESAVISILPELMEDHRMEAMRELQSIKEHTENEQILKLLKE